MHTSLTQPLTNNNNRTLQSGESPLHISDLRPCTSYSIRLLSPAAAAASDSEEDDGEVLWSFPPPATRTLPRPGRQFNGLFGFWTLDDHFSWQILGSILIIS